MKIRMTESRASYAFAGLSDAMAALAAELDAACQGVDGNSAEQLTALMRDLRSVKRIQRRPLNTRQEAEVARALRMSWATECQLRLRRTHDEELLPDLLHGVAPEAYYAVYHATRAALIAAGSPLRIDHRSALTQVSRIVERELLPGPLAARVTGGPSTFLTRATTEGSLVGRTLRTTRVKRIEELKPDWRKKEGVTRLTRAATDALADKLPATTVFDILWRFRTRSNYRDADAFLDGVGSVDEAISYLDSHMSVVDGLLTSLGVLAAAYAGREIVTRTAAPLCAGSRATVYDAVVARAGAVGDLQISVGPHR